MSSSLCTFLLMVTMFVTQVTLIVMVVRANAAMKTDWRTILAPKEGPPQKVYTAKIPRFWGPVHILLPTDCEMTRKFDELTNKSEKDIAQDDQVEAEGGPTTTEAPPSVETVASLAKQKDPKDTEQVAGRMIEAVPTRKKTLRLLQAAREARAQAKGPDTETPPPSWRGAPKPKHKVVTCDGRSYWFDDPNVYMKYFTYIKFSDMVSSLTKKLGFEGKFFVGSQPNMKLLYKTRLRTARWLKIGIAAMMLLKYGLKIVDAVTNTCGYEYVQLWNNGRTTFDKVLESMMIHGLSIVFTLIMQLTLCTLYLTFWREDHFVMTYLPGLGFFVFFVTFGIWCCIMICDRLNAWMVKRGNWYIYLFWTAWVVWLAIVAVPLMGFTIYLLQFMFEIQQAHWLREEPFSKDFVKAARQVVRYTWVFVGLAIVELAIYIKMDFDHAKKGRHPSSSSKHLCC